MMSAVNGTIDEMRARVRGFYDLPSSRALRQVPMAAHSPPRSSSPMDCATTAMPDAAGAVL
jgi:hypothetical protein